MDFCHPFHLEEEEFALVELEDMHSHLGYYSVHLSRLELQVYEVDTLDRFISLLVVGIMIGLGEKEEEVQAIGYLGMQPLEDAKAKLLAPLMMMEARKQAVAVIQAVLAELETSASLRRMMGLCKKY